MIPHNIRVIKNIKPMEILRCDSTQYLFVQDGSADYNKLDYDKVSKAIQKTFDHYVIMAEMYRDLSHLEQPMSGLLLLIRNYYLLELPRHDIDELINIYYKIKNDIEMIQKKYNLKPVTILVPDLNPTGDLQKKKTSKLSNFALKFRKFLLMFDMIKNKIKKLRIWLKSSKPQFKSEPLMEVP